MAVQYGNASIATILQFIGPFFIIAYQAMFRHLPPRRIEIISAIIAFLGVFIIATHGQFNHLAMTLSVPIWGLISAIGVATNTLIPQKHASRRSVPLINYYGVGLLFAGFNLNRLHLYYLKAPC